VPLDRAKRTLLQEALLEGAKVVEIVEQTVVGYGRWLLLHLFDDDSTAALDDKSDNLVWLELLRRAGGPTLKLSAKTLYNALRVAAYDRRITAESFRQLDFGRKELLLPLKEDRRLSRAAQHVSTMKLSQTATKTYVEALRREDGTPPAARLTAAALLSRIKSSRARLAVPKGKKLEKVVAALGKEERASFRTELTALIDDARDLLDLLRSR
jgi:hypothetical protein